MIRSTRDFGFWMFGVVLGIVAVNWYGTRASEVFSGLLVLAVPWDKAIAPCWHGICEVAEWRREGRLAKHERELSEEYARSKR
jgi:hypothetical protein